MTDWYVHVNQHIMRRNLKEKPAQPPIRIQKGKTGKPEYAFRVAFKGVVNYQPDGPPILKCGARLVIVCSERPEILA